MVMAAHRHIPGLTIRLQTIGSGGDERPTWPEGEPMA
jgi:hypothetical protein